jgi:uncharacterized protein YuzE
MMCAIFSLDNLSGTYYSSFPEPAPTLEMEILLNDFEDFLDEGQCAEITLDENGDVVLMEIATEDARTTLCYNVMKAYCQAWGLGIATPEYLGPYTLEVARKAFEIYGDYMTIIPAIDEGEVLCAS